MITRRTSNPHYERLMDSYRHDFADKWEFEDDNTFAQMVIHSPHADLERLVPEKASSLCERCRGIDFADPDLKIVDAVDELQAKTQEGCRFCAMRLRVVERVKPGNTIEFKRFASGLTLNFLSLSVLSLYRTSGRQN